MTKAPPITDPPPLRDPAGATAGALSRPLGQPPLARFVEPNDAVAVVVAAQGPGGSTVAIEPILTALRAAGARPTCLVIPRICGPRDSGRGELAAFGLPLVEAGDGDGDGSAYLPLGQARFGVARIDRHLARADRIVLLGPGGGALLAVGCADDRTAAAAAADPAALEEVLTLSPPSFLVELAFQRKGRPAAVFAGDTVVAHRAAQAFAERWGLDPHPSSGVPSPACS